MAKRGGRRRSEWNPTFLKLEKICKHYEGKNKADSSPELQRQ
jgi:hypothetical protein